MPTKRIDPKQATTREMMAFSLLPLGMYFVSTTVSTALNLYMTDILGFSMLYVSFIVLGTKVWDAVNDPLMGMIVERTRTKWGKCRPYLLWISPFLCVMTALLFYPFPFSAKYDGPNGNRAHFAVMLIIYMIYIAAYTAIEIPYNSMTPLVFPEQKSRVKAVSVSNIVGSLGTILPAMLIFTLGDAFGNGRNDPSNKGFFWAALLFALIGCAVIMGSFFGIREKVYIPPKKQPYFKGLKIVFSDRRMTILILCAFFSGFINVGAIFLPYFAKWNTIGILPMDEINGYVNGLLGTQLRLTSTGLMTPILQIGSGISYIISMALIPPLLKKMSKKQLWIWTSLIGAVANVGVYLVGVYLLPYTSAAGCVVYTGLRFLTNFPVGASLVLLIAMMADLTDEIELASHERLEATVFSFKSLLFQLAWAIMNMASLALVGAVGYHADTMDRITNGGTAPLIESTLLPSIVDGVDYTRVLNTIFFMLTAFGSLGLLLQAIPMFFFKESGPEVLERLAAYRDERDRERQVALEQATVAPKG